MPPRAVKRGGGQSSTPAEAPRCTKAEAAVSKEAGVKAEDRVKVEEVTATIVKEINEEISLEELPVDSYEGSKGVGANDPDEDGEQHEEEEENKHEERLDLEDNEHEYQEETAVDYDEHDMENVEEHEMDENEGHGTDMPDEEFENDTEDGENGNEGHEADHEEEEHHKVVKEHRKRKEFDVFVGGLDKDATEDDIRKVFSMVGEICEVKLPRNPITNKNKGFAFLQFATVEQAKRAVSELKVPMINGMQCGCSSIRDNDTLLVGNICKTWTKEHFKEKLKSFGVDNIEDLTLVDDTRNEGMNRGFAFLEFASHSEALEALRRLQKKDVFLGTERNAKVSFADSFTEPDDGTISQVFIDGLPAVWDEDRVRDCLKRFGGIIKVELARNMPSANRNDFGFVTFDTRDNAVSFAEGINNKVLGEGDNKVKVRARLCRPREQGRGNYGSRDMRIGQGLLPRSSYVSTYGCPPSHKFPVHESRLTRRSSINSRGYGRPPPYWKKCFYMDEPERPRCLPPVDRSLPPADRSHGKRPPAFAYPKSSSKRDYVRRDVPPTRNRAHVEHAPRVSIERHPFSYRDGYPVRRSSYNDIPPRSVPPVAKRRAYPKESYRKNPQRPPLASYKEGRNRRDYDSISGSKRSYPEMDDIPPHPLRPRKEYDVSRPASHQYNDAYGERLGHSHVGYGSSRDRMYISRQGMNYGEGFAGGSDAAAMYSSNYSDAAAMYSSNYSDAAAMYSSNYSDAAAMYSSNYSDSHLPQGSDVLGSSYSSMYSGHNISGSGYMGCSSSNSYD